MVRISLGKYKHSLWGFILPAQNNLLSHSLVCHQLNKITTTNNSFYHKLRWEVFKIDHTKNICSQGRQSINYKCDAKKSRLCYKSFTFKYWWRNKKLGWGRQTRHCYGVGRKDVKWGKYICHRKYRFSWFLKWGMPVNAKTKTLKTKISISNGKNLYTSYSFLYSD